MEENNSKEKSNKENNTDPNIQPSKIILRDIDKNEIDTSDVFFLLQDQWKNFDPHFLQTTVQDALQRVLLKNEVKRIQKKKGKDEYFESNSEHYFSFKAKEGTFPLPDYFIASDSLISYNNCCIVKREEAYYNLFFALKLALMDPMQVRWFLAYQLETYFESNLSIFKTYIEDLVVTYNGIINESAKKNTTSFFEHYENNKKLMEEKLVADTNLPSIGDQAEGSEETSMGLSTTQQCLILHFLLFQCGIIDDNVGEPKYGIEKKAVHDIITALTNKNADNVKKRHNNMFKTTEKILDENLRVIRPYFERLQLQDIVVQINKLIGEKTGEG